jgi:coenzyme F420 biosynthesis associated uncharacterized protein
VAGGLVAGAAVGLLAVAARRLGRDRADELLDWDQISAVALKTSGPPTHMSASYRDHAEADYRAMMEQVAGPLTAFTGISLSTVGHTVRPVNRPEWIEVNVANFRNLLGPFEDLYRESTRQKLVALPGLRAVGRAALSGEIGLLLGYLARRVLGQYDFSLLAAGPAARGAIYFVEPNVHAVQVQLGLPRDEFRLWLTLHEATHAHQFEGYPWVHDYLNNAVREYLRSMAEEIKDGSGVLGSTAARAIGSLRAGGSLMDAMMTPRQRDLVSRLQAVMCLLEGYSTYVMNAVGKDLLPHQEEIERRVEDRTKRRGAAEMLFLRLTGLQMKMDQYRLGEAFVNHVVRERGVTFMNRVWEGAENLPTEAEIRQPETWVQRIGAAGSAV